MKINKNILGISAIAILLVSNVNAKTSNDVSSLFNENYKASVSNSVIDNKAQLTDGELKMVDGKWIWIPIVIGVGYCSHAGYSSQGGAYYHWSCW